MSQSTKQFMCFELVINCDHRFDLLNRLGLGYSTKGEIAPVVLLPIEAK